MKFRKRPIVIEEEQFFESGVDLPFEKEGVCQLGPQGWFVETLEGPLNIVDGNWIIKGVKGEFYPCRSDIFKETYEPVND